MVECQRAASVRRGRQRQVERTAARPVRRDPQLPPVALHDPPRDRQPHPRPAVLIACVQALEHRY